MKKIYNSVLQILKQKRLEASLQAKYNITFASENLEISELEKKRRAILLKIAQTRFEEMDTSALRNELEEITESENALLKNINMSVADFELKIECVKCNDTGYNKAGICTCAKKKASELLFLMSGCEKKLAKFSDNENVQRNANIYQKMQEWILKENSQIKNILFVGGTGTGKTFLMECMANELIERGNYIFFSTAFEMILTCQKYHFAFEENKTNLLDPFLESDVLFIDDLGTEPMLKNITLEYLLMILNARLSKNLRTVISTNLLQEQIEQKYDERVFSRIFDKRNGVAIKFDGEDLRIKKGENK